MNAPQPPNDPAPNDPAGIDELISAYVDGVAAPDEIAIVEGSDELLARVESMRSVSALLGAPVTPPSDAVREDHLAAALGEFDLLFGDAAGDRQVESGATVTPLPQPVAQPEVVVAATAPAPEPQPKVASLAEARERKKPRRLNMVAAAAAAVAILFAGIVAVGLNSGGDTSDVVAEASSDAAEPAGAIESSDQMVLPEASDNASIATAPTPEAARASAADAMADDAMEEEEAMADDAMSAMADDAMEEEAMDDEAMADEEAVESDAEAAFAAPVEEPDDAADAAQSQPVGFLGAFAAIDDLAAAVTVDLDATTATQTATERSAFLPPSPCSEIAAELAILDTPTLLSTAFLDGEPVEIHAAADDQILILSSADCSVIQSVPAS